MGSVPPKPVSIDGPAGRLEAQTSDPDISGSRYAVVCHPHPLHGGTMDNKVVVTVARGLYTAGIPTIRFNFRGVGKSSGSYDHGVGEIDDASAAAAWGADRWPGRRLVLAGFSFGSYIALRLALQQPPALLITIAPAIEHFDVSGLGVPACRWLIVHGNADELVNPGAVMAWAGGLDPPPRLILLGGAGHFFHGRLQELRSIVAQAAADETARDEPIA